VVPGPARLQGPALHSTRAPLLANLGSREHSDLDEGDRALARPSGLDQRGRIVAQGERRVVRV